MTSDRRDVSNDAYQQPTSGRRADECRERSEHAKQSEHRRESEHRQENGNRHQDGDCHESDGRHESRSRHKDGTDHERGTTAASASNLRSQGQEGFRAAHGLGAVRRVLVLAGGLLMGYATFGALTEPGLKLGGVLLFLVSMVALHDGLFMPMVIAAGALVTRAGRLVRAAAIISLSVTVVALPFVLGYGRSADNPSALPLRYGLGLALVLTSIWVVTVAAMLVRHLRNRQNSVRTQKSPPGASDG